MATRLYPFLVALSLTAASVATAADNAAPPPSNGSGQAAPANTDQQGGGLSRAKSMLGGLFHRRPPVPQDASTTNGGMPDCAQVAKNKYAHTSEEACRQMASAQQ